MSFFKKTLLIISITIGLASVSKAEYYTFGLDDKTALVKAIEICMRLDYHRFGHEKKAHKSITINERLYKLFCDADTIKDVLETISPNKINVKAFRENLQNDTLSLTRDRHLLTNTFTSAFKISANGHEASFNLVLMPNLCKLNSSAVADRPKEAAQLIDLLRSPEKDLTFTLLGEEVSLIPQELNSFKSMIKFITNNTKITKVNHEFFIKRTEGFLNTGIISVAHSIRDKRLMITLNTPECLVCTINYAPVDEIAVPQHAGGLDLGGLLAAAAAKQKPVAVDKRLGFFWQPSQLYTVSSQQHRAPTFPDFAGDEKALNALKAHFRSCHYNDSICLDENIYLINADLSDHIFSEDDQLDAITFDETDATETHWYTLTFRTYGEFKLGLSQKFGEDHQPTFETEADIKQLITRLMIPNNPDTFRYEGINYLIQSTESYFLGNAGDPTATGMYIEHVASGEKLINVAGHTEQYQAHLGFAGKPNKALTFSLSIPLLQDNMEQALDVFPRFADRNADNDEIKRIATQFIISANHNQATTFKANLSSNIDLSLHVDREIDALTLMQLWNLDKTIQDTDLDKVEELVTVRRISEVIDNMDGTSSCRYLISYKRLEGNLDYNFTITANN